MAVQRLALTSTLDPIALVELNKKDLEYYLHVTKEKITREMGLELVRFLMDQTTPVTVRLSWQEMTNLYSLPETPLLRLIADLCPVDQMQIRQMVMPEPSWQIPNTPRIGVVEWQCGYCGHANEVAKDLECRKCGAPRKVMR